MHCTAVRKNRQVAPRREAGLYEVFEIFEDILFAAPHRENRRLTAKAKLATLFAQLRDRGFEPGSIAGWHGEEIEDNYIILSRSHTSRKNLPLASVAVEYLPHYLSRTRARNIRGAMERPRLRI
jgi:hypothetical protein